MRHALLLIVLFVFSASPHPARGGESIRTIRARYRPAAELAAILGRDPALSGIRIASMAAVQSLVLAGPDDLLDKASFVVARNDRPRAPIRFTLSLDRTGKAPVPGLWQGQLDAVTGDMAVVDQEGKLRLDAKLEPRALEGETLDLKIHLEVGGGTLDQEVQAVLGKTLDLPLSKADLVLRLTPTRVEFPPPQEGNR